VSRGAARPLRSALYVGRVTHRRVEPVEHAFVARLFMVYLDLGELPHVFRGRWLWGVERRALAAFHREDHLGDPVTPLKDAVRALVAERTGRTPEGPIGLLTQLRFWGLCFNPVSFYYCWDAAGERVETLVAEVHNTPWNERYCYVLPREEGGADPTLRFRGAKAFHVSPFMGMEQTYHWKVTEPGETLHVSIATEEEGRGRLFAASLDLARREITGASLARTLAAHPFMTARVLAGIYAHAFRLRRKGVPTFPHPGGSRSTALARSEAP
jgi:DUF1365 family protein